MHTITNTGFSESTNIRRSRIVWLPVWLGMLFAFTIIGLVYAIVKTLGLIGQDQRLLSDRVISTDGLIKKEFKEVTYVDIESVDIHQHWFERFLGYGDVLVIGKSGSHVVLRFVASPYSLREQLLYRQQRILNDHIHGNAHSV